MKKFKYRAKKGPDEIVEGVVLADTQDEVIDKINDMGLLPVDVFEERAKTSSSSGSTSTQVTPSALTGKVGTRHVTTLMRQLAKLIKSGVPILRALTILEELVGHPNLRDILQETQTHVREGTPLSAAFAAHPQVFSSFDIAMLQAGESSGNLDVALTRIAEYRQAQEVLFSRVRSGTGLSPLYYSGGDPHH